MFGVALSLFPQRVLYGWSIAKVSNGLVTSAILGPWLQFTLRGFVADTTTDEALTLKFLIVLAHILALWSLLHLGLLLPLGRLLVVPL